MLDYLGSPKNRGPALGCSLPDLCVKSALCTLFYPGNIIKFCLCKIYFVIIRGKINGSKGIYVVDRGNLTNFNSFAYGKCSILREFPISFSSTTEQLRFQVRKSWLRIPFSPYLLHRKLLDVQAFFITLIE